MKVLRGSSLRRSLMLVLMLSSGIALALTSLGFAINDWFTLRGSTYEHLQALAGIVGNNTAAALTFNDPDSAAETLNSLRSESGIVAGLLFDSNRQLFAEYQVLPDAIKASLPDQTSGVMNGHMFVTRPVQLGEQTIGHILLAYDWDFWLERQRFHFLIVASLFLLSLLVVYVISNRLYVKLTAPLLQLADMAKRITRSQDYSLRAEKLSRDEIGDLVDDFNGMLKQIELRENELQHARLALEEKVAERTSELFELTRQLEHQAYHDALTGLANRVTFDDRLRQAISHCERHGSRVAVLFLDLDRFKVINDTLGHLVGDQLLVQVAERLKHMLRDSDTLARLGGDEFAVLLMQPEADKDASEVASKLVATINHPFQVSGHSLHITTSIGISIYPEDGDNAETILKNADAAMYRSKDSGKNQFTFFAAEMNTRIVRRLMLENKLRNAISEQLLGVYYQPRHDARTLEIIGVEALVRWFDDEEGEISPTEFIPMAEECGLTTVIDQWVMQRACSDLSACFAGKKPPVTLSVNYSVAHFIRKDPETIISDVLDATGFPADRLELEITENLFGPESATAPDQLRAIGRLGVEIAIDDFGKAYSSLSRLKQLPLHTLKIDRSFIADLGRDPDDETLVRTIINLAHSLGLHVVAEGVETVEQYEFVRDYGCDAIQGFLFGKPMPIGELRKVLEEPRQSRPDQLGLASTGS